MSELFKKTKEWAQEGAKMAKERIDLLAKPEEKNDDDTTYPGFCISIIWYILFGLIMYAEYAPQKLTVPNISYSYPDTSSDLVINLNYTNFALTVTDPSSGEDISSKADLYLTNQGLTYSFIPINGSSFINCTSCDGFYTLNDNLALTSSTSTLLTFNTLDCTAEYKLCLLIPNVFSLNQSTGLFNNESSLETESCISIYPEQLVQFDYRLSPQSYTRTPGGLYGGRKPQTMTKFSHPDFTTYTYSRPQTCTTGATIFYLTIDLAFTTETVTITYLTFFGYLSDFGGLQHSVAGILGIVAVCLWKLKACDGKLKGCDGVKKLCNEIRNRVKGNTSETPGTVEMASPNIPIQPADTTIQVKVD